jgi:ketosteroid isomerase-like protein
VDSIDAFLSAFGDFWRRPSPARMGELLADDVVLVQPLSPPMHGLAAAQAEFARIFEWLPDLTGEVDRSSGRAATVFIEFRLRATLGTRPIEWPVVDRFTLRGQKAVERVTYFDSLPLVGRVLATPATWPGWWRSGAGRFWR